MKVLLPQMGRGGWRSSAHLVSTDRALPLHTQIHFSPAFDNNSILILLTFRRPVVSSRSNSQWITSWGLKHSDIESRAYATEPKSQMEGVIATVFLNCPPGQESCLRHGMVSECVRFQNIFKCSWPNPSPSGSECIPPLQGEVSLGSSRKMWSRFRREWLQHVLRKSPKWNWNRNMS